MRKEFIALKEVYKDTCLIILKDDNFYLYNEDARILEYISNIIGFKNRIKMKYYKLKNILPLFKERKISYVVIDYDIGNKVNEYYYTELNEYNNYIKTSKKFNKIRKYFIILLNLIYYRKVNCK